MSTVLNLHTYTAPMDYSYSRHSNSAGAPLPRIPRRSSSSSRSFLLTTVSAPSTPPATVQPVASTEAPVAGTSTVPTVLVVQPPTPPRAESAAAQQPAHDDASSSSSGSESYVQMHPRTKRTRTPKMQPFRSPADSTPTPAVFKSKSVSQLEKGVAFPARQPSVDDNSGNETPRASSSHSSPHPNLHIDLSDIQLTTLTTNIRAEGASNRTVSAPHSGAASIARKKSGEPLKSSLKSRRPVVRGDLSVITGEGFASSKSEPTTPMATKSVHFDSRLERVKLFLAEQKPLAISREGSPTDTSGTESDFPSAIYGSKRAGQEDKMLTMQLTNQPAVPRAEADLALEDLTLSEDGTCLNGRARVRNLAFEKWIAIRFTVDWWQTTSEVTAKYLDSVPGGVFDRFSFTIRLSDMLARIEEKTLFFALRYNVAGREIWDNNDGQNYKVTFAKVARPRPMPTSSSEGGLASLKSKLENVAKGRETVGGYMSQSKRKSTAPFTLDSSTSLSARYDFAASWKSPWTRSPPMSATPTKSSHARNVTYPHALPQFPKRMSKQAMFDDSRPAARAEALTRGSPHITDPWDASPIIRSPLYADEELDDTPMPIMSRRRAKNSQRGYFDLGASPSIKLTPTGSPTRGTSPSRGGSPERARTREPVRGMWFAVERGGSEESTPSVTSTSESSSPAGSPTEDLSFGFGGMRSPAESDSYSSFLNKYCYYTGASESFLDLPPEAIQRSHSASSVEEFLSTSPSPTYLLSPGETPTRSSSYDDVVSIGSGAATPTARSVGFGSLMGSPQMLSVAH